MSAALTFGRPSVIDDDTDEERDMAMDVSRNIRTRTLVPLHLEERFAEGASRHLWSERLGTSRTRAVIAIAGIALVARAISRRNEYPLHLPQPLDEVVNEDLSPEGLTFYAPPEAIDPVGLQVSPVEFAR